VRTTAIRIGLVVALVGAALIAASLVTRDGGGLRVGDCFNSPTDTDQTENVVVPCAEAHDGEVMFVGDFEPATDAYPSEDALVDFETDRCLTAFQSYTGLDFTLDQRYGMAPIRPTLEEWRSGGRKVVCYGYLIDGSKLTKSIRRS
jgi:hypothetical protein